MTVDAATATGARGDRKGLDELLVHAAQLKAAFVDLDGTFLAPDHTMPARGLAVTARLQATGVHLVPATGRTVSAIHAFFGPLAKAMDCVASNGMDVVVGGVPVFRATYEPAWVRSLLDTVVASTRRLGMVVFEANGAWVMDLEAAFVHKHIESMREAPVRALEKGLPTGSIVKVAVVACTDPDTAVRELGSLMGDRFAFARCGEHWIDVSPVGIDKAGGVRTVMAHLGARDNEVVAFGDSMNDVGMMRTLPLSVAVANGLPGLKEACAYEIGSNGEEAVLDCLERIAAAREELGLGSSGQCGSTGS